MLDSPGELQGGMLSCWKERKAKSQCLTSRTSPVEGLISPLMASVYAPFGPKSS
jgi:hypothetical protein